MVGRLPAMRNSPIKFLLLICFAFWATGLAQYAHERIEHGDVAGVAHDHRLAIGSHGQDTHALRLGARDDAPRKDHHPDSHDDCPTCAMFAAMAVRPAMLPPVIAPPQATICRLTVPRHVVPAAPFEQFPPSRAPPVSA